MKQLVFALLLGCCGGTGEGPTGAVCPSPQTLTYENFGKNFMDTYCTRCHSSMRNGNDRFGAPSGHDYDSVRGVRATLNHIDEQAAAGPDATNDTMPPGAPFPTAAERTQLGEWIACGAP